MYRSLIRFGFLAAGLSAVGACTQQLPPDVSPHYVRVRVESPEPPHRVKYVLVPDACLDKDPTAYTVLGETLPPGCANAYNLLRMAERKGDLEHGRPLGKASGVTTAKAAQKYLDGDSNGALGASPQPESAGSSASDANDAVNSPGKTIKPKN
jgi:hypothetical protein